MPYEYARSEYLRALLNQKNALSNNDSLVNPSVSNDIEGLSRLNTKENLDIPEQPKIEEENDRNGWQRGIDTVRDTVNNITEGMFNFVDDIADGLLTVLGGITGGIGALFGADFNEGFNWAAKAIDYDWQSHATELYDKYSNIPLNILSGDAFKKETWELFNGSRDYLNKVKSGSVLGDNQTYQNITIGIGQVLPSVALAIGTGGLSLPAQIGINAGASAIGGLGSGTSKALQEGADYRKAFGYGAVQGLLQGGITALTFGIGGALGQSGGAVSKLSSNVGTKIFEKTGSKMAGVFAGKTMQILAQSGIAAGKASLNTLVDPVLSQIYDDSAIEQAYGTDEGRKQLFARMGNAALNAAIISTVIGVGKEGIDFARRGSDGYTAKFYAETTDNLANKMNKETDNLTKQLKRGNISVVEYKNKLTAIQDKYVGKIERYGSLAVDSLKRAYDKAQTKSTSTELSTKIDKEQFTRELGRNKDTASKLLNTQSKIERVNDILNNTSNYLKESSIDVNADYSSNYERIGYEQGEKIYSNGLVEVRFNATTGDVTTPNPTNPNNPIPLIPYNNNFSIYNKNVLELPSTLALADESTPKSIIINDKNISDKLLHLDIQLFGKKDIDNIKKPENYIKKPNGDIEIKLNNDESLVLSDNGNGIMQSNFVENDGTTRSMFNDSEVIDKQSVIDNNPVEIPKEYYKAVAELNNPKVYNYSEVKDTVAKISNEILTNAKYNNSKVKVLYDGKGLLKTSNDIFKLLNRKNLTEEDMMQGLAQIFKQITIQTPRGNGIVTSELGDYLNIDLTDLPSVRAIVNTALKDLTENNGHEGKVQFLKRVYGEMKNHLVKEIREQKARGRETLKYKQAIQSIPNYIKRVADISFDEPTYHEVSLLFKPIINLHRNGTNTLYVGELKENIANLLAHYTEEEVARLVNERGGFMFYDENIRLAYENLHDNLQDKQINIKTGNPMNYRLTANQIRQVNDLVKMVKAYSKTTIENYREYAMPTAYSTIKAINERGKIPFTSRLKGRAYVIQDILGNSPVAKEMTVSERVAEGNKRVFEALYKQDADNYLDKNKLRKPLAKKYELNGYTLSGDNLADIYGIITTKDGFNMINDGGLHFQDNKHTIHELYEKGRAEEILSKLEEILPKEIKDSVAFFKNQYNAPEKLKGVYSKYWEDTYHIKQANIVDDFYPTSRDIDAISSVEHAVKAMPMFVHAKSRVKNNNPVLVGSMLKRYSDYVSGLSKEIYIKPQLRKIYGVLNVKTSEGNVVHALKNNPKVNTKHQTAMNFIDNNLKRFAGVMSQKDMASMFVLGQYSKSVLGLPNLATPIRQLFSLLTGSFNNTKVFNATMKYMFNSEFRKQVNEIKEKIGNVKYRNRQDTLMDTSVRKSVLRLINDVTDKLMVGVDKADKLAITLGLATAYDTALKDGLDVESDDFFERVAEYYFQFDLSQINSDYLGTNEINDTGFKFLMLFQKPAMVALGSIENRFNLWKNYRNTNEEQLQKNYENACKKVAEEKEKLDDLQSELDDLQEQIENAEDKDTKKAYREEYKSTHEDYKEQEKEYYKAKGDEEYAKNEQANFRRFKAAGGKGALISIGVTTIALGLANTLLTEVWQRTRGKKEWDEFDAEDLGKEFSYNAFISWIPLLNTLTNAVSTGYDVTLPTADLVSSFTQTIHSISESIQNHGITESTAKTLLRNGFSLVSGLTGIPFKNIYDLTYGIQKMFNPELALEFKNVFYFTSSQYASRTYNSYVEGGKYEQADIYLKYMMSNFKTGNVSNSISQEMLRLAKSGNSAMPKNYMTEYNDEEGNRIELTEKQIQAFRKEYNNSNPVVTNVIKDNEYRKQDTSYQAKIIKKIYDSYYSYAKAKVLNTKADSKIANLLLYTNGVADISKMMTPLVVIAGITDDKNKTKKDLVFEYINSNRTLTKAEKLLVLYLAGYSSNEENTNTIKNLLRQLGMNNKDIKEFLNVK